MLQVGVDLQRVVLLAGGNAFAADVGGFTQKANRT